MEIKLKTENKDFSIEINNNTMSISGKGISDSKNIEKIFTETRDFLEKNISIISQREKIFFVNINIEYFNKYINIFFSQKLHNLFKYFENLNDNKVISVEITWKSNDEDLLNTAEDYRAWIRLPFKIVKES
ncbi:hypothetical protein IT403_03485 [Candidatus Nomurabacteria bacterium]|nr:hypothetical protein [Candidatus Nomurabacteria bacterium]